MNLHIENRQLLDLMGQLNEENKSLREDNEIELLYLEIKRIDDSVMDQAIDSDNDSGFF
jgi:hypothetical protein